MRKTKLFVVCFTRAGMLQSMFRKARTATAAIKATRKALKGITGVSAEAF